MRPSPQLTAALLALALVVSARAQTPAREDADRALQKLQAVVLRPLATPPPKEALRTTFTDRELNAYLHHHSAELLPAGIQHVQLALLEGQQFETRALIDFDVIRKSQPRGMLDPLAYVRGTMALVARAALAGSAGKGVLKYESATLGGVPVPRLVLQEVLAWSTRSEEWPQGLQLDQPFDLPSGIREIQVRRGAATVVQ